MSRPGPKPKPVFQVVREGNPGHKRIGDPVVLPPDSLVEPDWRELLTGDTAEDAHARTVAAELWERTALVLERSVGLVRQQQDALVDLCVTRARIVQGERALGREGVIVASTRADRGAVRNPWTTVLNQYRSHFRSLTAELGLTPSAATRLTRPDTEDDDDPFD